jgi:DNA-directed RNA polymerase subunit RPC12/RpoP
MEKSNLDSSKDSNTFGCIDCGADLKFTPGTTSLSCEYCGAANEIPVAEVEIAELDYEAYLENATSAADQLTVNLVKCQICAAESTLQPHITSASCPYCDTPLIVADAHEENILKPKSLLPFKITKEEAIAAFKKWINKLWFAPNALKKAVLSFDHFKGVYLPFWTYDSKTTTSYTGQRGRHYYVSESYTTTENGKTVSKTRQVRRTRWTFVTGRVNHAFDDVLVPASNSLPEKQLTALEPWDLENLVPFTTEFLSGFITEKYQVNLKSGFDKACDIMNVAISSLIGRDIGGDEQRVLSKNTQHKDITFKHLLLPAYVSAYNFKGKLYQFMVNARTGEVQGERPYSWIKITLAIVLGLAIIGAIYLAAR